jgi:hypothetical protein
MAPGYAPVPSDTRLSLANKSVTTPGKGCFFWQEGGTAVFESLAKIAREIRSMNATQLITVVSIAAMAVVLYALHVLQQAIG